MPGTTIVLTPISNPTPPASLGHAPQVTAYDVVEMLMSYLGGAPDSATHGDVRRAITASLREFPKLHDWTAFIKVGRIFLQALYNAGTITYQHTGGMYERMMTLASGTWPSWVDRAYIRVGLVAYYVDRRISDTIITLDEQVNPGADLVAGTSYDAIQDSYLLPADFSVGDRGLPENNWWGMKYMRADEWLAYQRKSQSTAGQPRYYTFTADPKNRGRLCVRIFPPPTDAQTLDFLYRANCRNITTFDQTTGKASATAADNSVTLSGGGTFNNNHVGSVLRLSTSSTNAPNGQEGLYPYSEERTILRLSSSTVAVVDDLWANTYASVAYRLSDPVDVEQQAMFNAFYMGCLRWLLQFRNRKELGDAIANWRLALNLAKEADKRDVAQSRVNLGVDWYPRMIDMPMGPYVASN